MSEASDLRKKLALVAQAKRELSVRDTAEHMALPPGERLRATLEWSGQVMAMFPLRGDEAEDDEAATWARVHARLHRR